MLMVPGAIKCPGAAPFAPLCGATVEIEQYKNGKWISVRDSKKGNPLDVSTF
jgi:hypothetical protein